MSRFVLGVDLGQLHDWTALSLIEDARYREPPRREEKLVLRFMERMREVPYPGVVDRVIRVVKDPQVASSIELVLDATGVGVAVTDMFMERGVYHKAVTIHGGDSESRGSRGEYRVPKRDLVSALQVASQSGRFEVAPDVGEIGEVFSKELLDFRIKITAAGHDQYGVWREGEHDDLVLAAALAVWVANKSSAAHVLPIFLKKPGGSYWKQASGMDSF